MVEEEESGDEGMVDKEEEEQGLGPGDRRQTDRGSRALRGRTLLTLFKTGCRASRNPRGPALMALPFFGD